MIKDDFHDLFRANFGHTRPDPNKVFTDKLKTRAATLLEIPNSRDLTLGDVLGHTGTVCAMAKRLRRPFDLCRMFKHGVEGEILELFVETHSINPAADYHISFFGRRGSNMPDMFISNSDMFISNKMSYIRLPAPSIEELDFQEVFLQTVDGFFDNLPYLRK